MGVVDDVLDVDMLVEEAASAVSGKGKAGLSTLPLGLRGIRFRGTNTVQK